MGRGPVEVVTRIGRHHIWRNTAFAAAAVVATAFGVTATVVTPATTSMPSTCGADQTRVWVGSYPITLTLASAVAPVAQGAHTTPLAYGRDGARVTGCVDLADLTPAHPYDHRG